MDSRGVDENVPGLSKSFRLVSSVDSSPAGSVPKGGFCFWGVYHSVSQIFVLVKYQVVMLYLRELVGNFQFRPAGDGNAYSDSLDILHLIKEIKNQWNVRIIAFLGSAEHQSPKSVLGI
jgi:hypothetical protein